MYLIDTNALSEQRKAKTGKADRNVESWFDAVSTDLLFVSVVSLRELETGVRLKERRDAAQGKMLRKWLDSQVRPAFAGRILPVTEEIALRCAGLFVPDPRPFDDAYIAATALVHNFAVVTQNVADFAPMGVKLLNPWEPQ